MNILLNCVDYTEFLIKHKLTPNQFLLLYLLYTERLVKSKTGSVGYAMGTCLYKWQDKGSGWSQHEIEDLVKKDYMIAFKKTYEVKEQKLYGYAVDDLILTNKFADIMFINTDEAFEEIVELYPDTFTIQTQTVFTKTGDLDKISDNYNKLIKGSLYEHDVIKQVIVYAKEKGMCNMKLEKFLSKGVVDSIKKMMEESYSNGRDI